MSDEYFSRDYAEAKQRFMDAAAEVGATRFSYPIPVPSVQDLTIDVAIIGPDDAPAVFVSSGVHGVEGFVGSAVQLAFLQRLKKTPEPGIKFIFLHALNPFGFSQIRRVNEDNADLNRNFLIPPAEYQGAPEGYDQLNSFLNPEGGSSESGLFILKAIWAVARHGFRKVRQAVVGGQYKYPRGLFFGGSGPSQSARCVFEHCDQWVGNSPNVIHVDIHTGLGRYATYKLLLQDDETPERVAWYAKTFGKDCIEVTVVGSRTSYRVSGGFGGWLQKHFQGREYRYFNAEFGTYSSLPMLQATRAENRAFFYGSVSDSNYEKIKADFMESFVPKNPQWREKVVQSALKIIEQAVKGSGT